MMKIGEFAGKNKVSIDTVRHYMDLNLVMPTKIGGQYDFDDQCQNSLDDILDLKKMGFTLNEIKTIFLFKTFGSLTHYQQEEYYRTLFIDKQTQVNGEIENLKKISERLNERINALAQYKSKKNFNLGVDVSALHVFKCMVCGGDMAVDDGVITDNQLIDGMLKCACGQSFRVQDGIVVLSSDYVDSTINFDKQYIANYISKTDYHYLDSLYKSIDFINHKIEYKNLCKKVVLELGSGVGFLLRSIFEKLPEDCIYIAVDHDIKRHQFLKGMLERANEKRNIIFICSDFLKLPIGKKSVDVLFDFAGTSNYSFEHESFLLDEIDDYIKEDASLLGSYIVFKNFSADSKIPDAVKHNFSIAYIKQHIKRLKYEKIDDKVSDYLISGGKYEDYFVEGEKVFTYIFNGKRLG